MGGCNYHDPHEFRSAKAPASEQEVVGSSLPVVTLCVVVFFCTSFWQRECGEGEQKDWRRAEVPLSFATSPRVFFSFFFFCFFFLFFPSRARAGGGGSVAHFAGYPRAVWIQNGNAHTSSDKGSKTSKQTCAVLLFYFHWPVAANQPEYRRVRCGVITVHSAGQGQRLSLSHVPHGITWHFAYLNSECYSSRN